MNRHLLFTLLCAFPFGGSLNCVAETPVKQPILDGTTVPESEYPYVGRISYRGSLLCSGTLVSSKFILTAAHCFYDERNTRVVGDTDLTVRLNGREIASKRAIIYPTYRSRSQACVDGEIDAALIELADPVSDTQSIPLIEAAVPVGATVTLVGYGCEGSGATGENRAIPPLGFVNIGTTRVEGFGGDPGAPDSSSDYYFWRFDSGESNTGSGDSGGPAFYDSGSQRYLSGITCGGDDRGQFGTYSFNTRGDVLRSWVQSVTGDVPPGTPPSFATAGSHTATRGKPFSYDIPVSGSAPLNVTATGLPEGLTIVGRTIMGTPQVAGVYKVAVTAQNEFGSQSSVLTLVVAGYTPRVQLTRATLAFQTYGRTDSLNLTGKIAVGSNFRPHSTTVRILLGRYSKNFRLGSSGRSTSQSRSFFNLGGVLRRGRFTSSTVSFDLQLTKVALYDAVSTLGFIDNMEALDGQGVYLPISISINGIEATTTVLVRFSERTQTWRLR